jgi:hypothetical protein
MNLKICTDRSIAGLAPAAAESSASPGGRGWGPTATPGVGSQLDLLGGHFRISLYIKKYVKTVLQK